MEMKSASSLSDKKPTRFRRLNNREKAVAVAVLAALLVGSWLPERISISTSPSLQHRVFFLSKTKSNITTGDYLIFRHEDTSFTQKGLKPANQEMIKQVGCSPGESLTQNDDKKYFCNQRYLGTALVADSTGRLLPTFQFIGPIPKNNYFMVGSNPRSFDSKYFGFIHAEEILYTALPLW